MYRHNEYTSCYQFLKCIFRNFNFAISVMNISEIIDDNLILIKSIIQTTDLSEVTAQTTQKHYLDKTLHCPDFTKI